MKLADKMIRKTRQPLTLVHSDFSGPIGTRPVWKARYLFTIYDDTSASSIVRFNETKYQTSWPLKSMIVELQSVLSNRACVRRIRVNNGRENVGKNLKDWFMDNQIRPEYSPHHHRSRMVRLNGSVERY